MLTSYLALAAILFCLGLYGVLIRTHRVFTLFSLMLMWQGIHLNLLAFSRYGFVPSQEGEILAMLSVLVMVAVLLIGFSLIWERNDQQWTAKWRQETKWAQRYSLIGLCSGCLLLMSVIAGRLWL